MTPCVSYMRVSSEEQAKVGFSIPFQRARLEQYAGTHDFEVTARFEETHSAKQEGRPEFRKMLTYLEEHPSVRVVLVHKHDRLSRNLIDFGTIRDRLGCRVLAIEEPVENSAAGRLHQNISLSMAAYHSDNLSQEVEKGLKGKFEEGGVVTRAMVGYKNITRTRTRKAYVVVDPEAAPLIRLLFERFATGRYSLRRLAAQMADEGLRTATGKPYPPQRVRNVLAHPLYKGLVTYRGELRPGKHDAIVSAALWDRVQAALRNRSADHGEKGTKFFLLRGLLSCGTCGRQMTAEDHPGGSYYHCLTDRVTGPCGAPYVPVASIDQAAVDLLPEVSLRPERQTAVLAALDQLGAERERARASEEHGLRQRREKIQARLHRLTECLVDGTLSRDQYLPLRDQYERETAMIDDRLAFLGRDLSADIHGLKQLLDRSSALAELYAAARGDADRKALLREVFAKITVENKTIKGIEYNPPFHLLLGDTTTAGSGMKLEKALLDHVSGHSESR